MSKTGRISGQPFTHTVATVAAMLALIDTHDIHEGDRALVESTGELYEALPDGANYGETSGWLAIGAVVRQATGAATWAAAHDVKPLGITLPHVECALEIWAKASTGTPEIDIGHDGDDSPDKDYFVDGQALATTWKPCTMANRIPDQSKPDNRDLTIEVSADGGWDSDSSENFTGSVTVLVIYRRLALS